MIASLRGILLEKGPDNLVIEAGGVWSSPIVNGIVRLAFPSILVSINPPMVEPSFAIVMNSSPGVPSS